MSAPNRRLPLTSSGVERVWRWAWLASAALTLAAISTHGQDVVPPADKEGAESIDGGFITVPNPLTSAGKDWVIDRTMDFLDKREGKHLKIAYDFNPRGEPSRTSDYGVCRDLADFLLKKGGTITTIAFVHNEVTEHTILPVLACSQVVLSHNGRLGAGLGKPDKPGAESQQLGDDQRLFYEKVARLYSSPAVVMKTVDWNLEVVEGTDNHGTRVFIDKRRMGEKGFQPAPAANPPLAARQYGLYNADQAERYGICKIQLETRKEVEDNYRLPAGSVREVAFQGSSKNAWRIKITGELTRAARERIERGIRKAIAKGGNRIIVQLECGGSNMENTQVAREMADFLRNLKDNDGTNGVMTIAYFTERARECATFVAIGCTEIVIDEKARLGDFETLLKKRPNDDWAISQSLAELAEQQGYPPLLARGMLERKLDIHRAVNKKKPAKQRLMTAEEIDADPDGEWAPGVQIKPAGELLWFDGAKAKEYGLARDVFSGNPSEADGWLKKRFGIERIDEIPNDWLGDLARFLCEPVVSVFLVMIGITGLILELKIPGVGLPGVIAAICFVLYFWANSQVAGHMTILAILLFILGLILIGLEVFLVPGLGITGISGVILVVVSLGLVTLVKMPQTSGELLEFGGTLTTLTLGVLAAVGAAFAIAYYLPHIPWANRMVLAPPDGHAEILEEDSPAAGGYGALLGVIGEAATTLRPAGKARFGDEFVDVVAEGSYVLPGARVQVIEIEGNRIVVKEV
jgi:membrane-bound ClpP family serine protease